MKKILVLLFLFSFTVFSLLTPLEAAIPNEFTDGTVASAEKVNDNFDYLENKFSTTGGHDHDGSSSRYITILGTIPGALTVGGTTTLSGAINLNSDITATGDITAAGSFTIVGQTVTGELNVGRLSASQPVFSTATGDLVSVNPVPLVNGGTASTSAQTAINTLAGAVTANRVLRANGSNILLAQVVLTTDVTGVLPLLNGGTASTTGMHQIFTSSGTFTSPAGVTTVYVTLVGAGGGGGGGGNATTESGGGGGGGASIINMPYTVTAETGYTVTINSGGAGGIGETAAGGNGGTTTFGNINALGGTGGTGGAGGSVGTGGAGGVVTAASSQTGGVPGLAGYDGANGVGQDYGGGGGASAIGAGGNGVQNANGGAGGAYGGGGAGGGGENGTEHTGGAGNNGCVIVAW